MITICLAGVTEEQSIDGTTRNFSHDKLGRLTQFSSAHYSLENLQYDPVGNLSSLIKKTPIDKSKASFSYDDLYQLTEEKGLVNHTYTHDSLYNRTQKDKELYALNFLNQLLSCGDKSFKYDANGNLISQVKKKEEISYTYDALDRLIEVNQGSLKESYTYDASHRRLSRTCNGQKQTFFYIGQQEVGSFDKKGLLERRVLGICTGAEIGGTIAIKIRDYPLSSPIHDQNGNIIGLIDVAKKKPIETVRYSAFGVEEKVYPDSKPKNPWRFSSKRLDFNTGLIFFGRRYYDPEIGRWVTADPQKLQAGPNLYSYVMNNPLTRIDLWGLSTYNDDWVRSETSRKRNERRASKQSGSFSPSSSSSTTSHSSTKYLQFFF